MRDVYRLVLLAHIACGIVGFFAFWTPALTRKGGRLHMAAGRAFFYATSGIALSGLAITGLLLADPIGIKVSHPESLSPDRAAAIVNSVRVSSLFLLYLVLITFTPVHHGVRVLATRHSPAKLRTRFHTTLNVATLLASLSMVFVGLWVGPLLFLYMSPIGLLIGWGNLQFARKPYPTPMAWWYEHMGSMLGGGIAFHTAFLVLGAGRLSGIQLEGPAAAIPWLLPTMIGVPASAVWTNYYKKRFNESAGQTAVADEPLRKTA